MPDDDHHKKLVDDLNHSFENIERVRNAAIPDPYSDLAKSIDGQGKIAAERAAGRVPASPRLTVIDGDKLTDD